MADESRRPIMRKANCLESAGERQGARGRYLPYLVDVVQPQARNEEGEDVQTELQLLVAWADIVGRLTDESLLTFVTKCSAAFGSVGA